MFSKKASIQCSVLNGFKEMVFGYYFRSLQIGNGPGYAQDLVVGPGRKVKIFHGRIEEGLALFVDPTKFLHILDMGIDCFSIGKPFQLNFAGTLYAGLY